MFERFTAAARQVVIAANEESARLGHGHIGTEHLLLGLLNDPQDPSAVVLGEFGVAHAGCAARLAEIVATGGAPGLDADALRSVGIDLEAVRRKVEETFGPGALDAPAAGRTKRHSAPFTPRSKKVLQLALREAVHLGHKSIGTEHLLLGLLREGRGLAARILTDLGADLGDLRTAVQRRLDDVA